MPISSMSPSGFADRDAVGVDWCPGDVGRDRQVAAPDIPEQPPIECAAQQLPPRLLFGGRHRSSNRREQPREQEVAWRCPRLDLAEDRAQARRLGVPVRQDGSVRGEFAAVSGTSTTTPVPLN